MLGVKLGRAQKQALKLHFSKEIGFGEGRALIGRHVLAADQSDLALKTARTKFGDKAGAGLPATHNNEMIHHLPSGLCSTSPYIVAENTGNRFWEDNG